MDSFCFVTFQANNLYFNTVAVLIACCWLCISGESRKKKKKNRHTKESKLIHNEKTCEYRKGE